LELKALNKTVLISTHMIDMIKELWDRVIFMKNGQMLATVTREDVNNKDLEELFFEITGGEND